MPATKPRRLIVALLCLAAASAAGAQTTARTNPIGSAGATSAPFWTGVSDAASFEHAMDARLGHAQARLDELLAVTRGRTLDNTLRPYDDVLLELDAVSSQAQLVQSVHPDERMRQTAERISQKASAFATAGRAGPAGRAGRASPR